MKLTSCFLSKCSNAHQAKKNSDDSSDITKDLDLKSNPYYEKYAEKIEKLK